MKPPKYKTTGADRPCQTSLSMRANRIGLRHLVGLKISCSISELPMNRRERPAQKKTDAGELTPAAQCEAGHRLLQSGQPLEAQICCQKLLASDPNHAGALHLMGLIAFRAGQYDHALEWTARAIAQEPKPDYIASLATTLLKQGRREEALKAFDKAVQ